MSKITEKFLIEHGYKEYTPSALHGDPIKFWTKKIDFLDDTKPPLYIDISLYDYTKFGGNLIYEFAAQINRDYPFTTFNVNTVNWINDEETVYRAENLFMELYELGQRYSTLKIEK